MNISKFTDQIGELIAQNDLPKAISLLSELLKNSPKLDEIIIQSARFSDLSQQIRLGTVSFDDANITKNKIRFAILDLIRDIEMSYETHEPIQNEINDLPEQESTPTIDMHHTGSGNNIIGNVVINNNEMPE
jgi:Effector-associated domain 11